jgi:hypothetical protein
MVPRRIGRPGSAAHTRRGGTLMRVTAFCATLRGRRSVPRISPTRMHTRSFRLLTTAVAAIVAATVFAAPALAVAPPKRPPVQKAQPTQQDRYVPGQLITVNSDVLSASGMPAWAIDQYLAAHTPLPPLGTAFLAAEREYGVNAIVLVAIAMHESGYGTSEIARIKKNLFGYHAYDRDPFLWAEAFSTYAEGVDVVARYIRDGYLVPGGSFYTGYRTLRSINLAYASSPVWQNGVVAHANRLIREVPTLAMRKLKFGAVRSPDAIRASTVSDLTVGWTAVKGATIPSGIRFSTRWTPVSIVETAVALPRRPGDPQWLTVARATSVPGRLTLSVKTPAAPGLWRLDLDPRDSDGGELPASDHPRIASSMVRVHARGEAVLALGAGADDALVATVRSSGPGTIRAAAETPSQELEAWAVPLDGSSAAVRLASVRVTDAIGQSAVSLKVPLAKAALPALVVLRLTGSTASRAVPAVVLVRRGSSGRPVVTAPWIVDPRTSQVTDRAASEPAPVDVVGTGVPGVLGVRVSAKVIDLIATPLPDGSPAPAPTPTPAGVFAADASPAAASPAPGAAAPSTDPATELSGSRIVVRTIAVTGPARPSLDAAYIPAHASGALQLSIDGLGPGVRLVVAWLQPEGGAPTPFWAGWLEVTGDAP